MRKKRTVMLIVEAIGVLGLIGVCCQRVSAKESQQADLIGVWYTSPPILGHIQYIYKFASNGKVTQHWDQDGCGGASDGTWVIKDDSLILTLRHKSVTKCRVTPGPTTFTTTVEKLTFSGDRLTFISPDGTDQYPLVKAASGAYVPTLRPLNYAGYTGFVVLALAISSDGGTLAELGWWWYGVEGGDTGELRIWDLKANRLKRMIKVRRPIQFSDACIAFSPDGFALACSGGHHTDLATVTLWDLRTFQETTLGTFEETALGVPAFSPDGKTLAVGGARLDRSVSGLLPGTMRQKVSRIQEVYVLNTGTHKLERTLEIGTDPNFSINVATAFSPDGNRLAAAGANGNLTLWETRSYQPVGRLTQTAIRSAGYSWYPLSLSFSPDGRSIGEGMMSIWLGNSVGPNPPDAFLFWDVRSEKLKTHRKGSDQAYRNILQSFSPSSEAMTMEMSRNAQEDTPPDSLSRVTIHIWGQKTPEFTIMPPKEDVDIGDLVISPDGSAMALNATRPDAKKFNSVIEIWDLKTRKLTGTLKEPAAP